MGEVTLSRPEEWRRKIDAFQAAGAGGLRVVSDWDRTLTRASAADRRDQSTYSMILNGDYLGAEYNRRSQALFDAYRGVETSPHIPEGEKEARMQEWWRRQFDLLGAFGFGRAVIRDMVERDDLLMRDGAEDFFQILDQHTVPLLILSAGIQQVIEGYLVAKQFLTRNVQVVANTLTFDDRERANGYEKPLIHSLNKNRVCVQDSGGGGGTDRRSHVLLLGDTLEDSTMCEGIDRGDVIGCGFLNDHVERDREAYASAYDVVIPNDGPLDLVNGVLERVCGA